MGIVEQLINMNTETISIPETHSKIRESDQSESETSDSEEEDVPLELKSEFVAALMGRKYEEALKLCNIILKFDASHELALQYRPLLEQAVESVESESKSSSDSESSSFDSSESDSESEEENDLAETFESKRVQSGKART